MFDLKFEFTHLRLLGFDKTKSFGFFNDSRKGRIIQFPVNENKSIVQDFYRILEAISQTSRREKFLRVYRIFEYYNGRPSLSWRAVRVSMSHSTINVTEKSVVKYLLHNFGELDITFGKKSQIELFYKLFLELVEETYSILLNKLQSIRMVDNRLAQEISLTVRDVGVDRRQEEFNDMLAKMVRLNRLIESAG